MWEETINKYKKIGFNIGVNNNWIIVKAKKLTYKIGIIQIGKDLSWYLFPFNNSYYISEYIEGKSIMDRLLFAIKENEELYLN